MSLWHASNNLYARLPNDPTPQRRSVSDTPISAANATFASAAYSTPIRISPPGGNLASKADKSENWRQKLAKTPGGTDIPPIPTANPTDPTSVMTIDALFDKFNMDEERKANVRAIIEDDTDISSRLLLIQRSKMCLLLPCPSPDQPSMFPLGQSSAKRDTPRRTRSLQLRSHRRSLPLRRVPLVLVST